MEQFVNLRNYAGRELNYRPEALTSRDCLEFCKTGVKSRSLCLVFYWDDVKLYKPDVRTINLYIEGERISRTIGTLRDDYMYINFYGLIIKGYARHWRRIAYVRSGEWMHVFKTPFLFSDEVEEIIMY